MITPYFFIGIIIMKYTNYIHIKKLDKKYLYGIMTLVNDSVTETIEGIIGGERSEVLDKLTKYCLKRNKPMFERTMMVFKYDTLDDTKEMLYKFNHLDYYNEYKKENNAYLDALPAVFLSDMDKLNKLNKKMNYHLTLLNYYGKNIEK
jgi:hypothetical protein